MAKDPRPAQQGAEGQTQGNRPTWPALVSSVLIWVGATIGLFAVFNAVAGGLDPDNDADKSTLLTLFVVGILFVTQVIPATAGALTLAVVDKRLQPVAKAAGIFAIVACALGLLGTFLYVTLSAGDSNLGVDASTSMVTLYLLCLAADGAAAAGISYFAGRALEQRRQAKA